MDDECKAGCMEIECIRGKELRGGTAQLRIAVD